MIFKLYIHIYMCVCVCVCVNKCVCMSVCVWVWRERERERERENKWKNKFSSLIKSKYEKIKNIIKMNKTSNKNKTNKHRKIVIEIKISFDDMWKFLLRLFILFLRFNKRFGFFKKSAEDLLYRINELCRKKMLLFRLAELFFLE